MQAVDDPLAISRWPATAHLPGAVEDMTCGDCLHLDPCSDKRRGRCLEHWRMRGLSDRFTDVDDEGKRYPNWWRGLRAIDRVTPACKYFVEKPAEANDGEEANGVSGEVPADDRPQPVD